MNQKKNTMRVKATYGRKVPAAEKFSTDYVELGMEIDVEVGDETTYADAVAKCFAEVKASVDREVERCRQPQVRPTRYVRHPDDHDYITVPAEGVEALERHLGVKLGPQS